MTPRDLDRNLSRYLDGSLGAHESALIQQQLTARPEVARRLAELSLVEASLQETGGLEHFIERADVAARFPSQANHRARQGRPSARRPNSSLQGSATLETAATLQNNAASPSTTAAQNDGALPSSAFQSTIRVRVRTPAVPQGPAAESRARPPRRSATKGRANRPRVGLTPYVIAAALLHLCLLSMFSLQEFLSAVQHKQRREIPIELMEAHDQHQELPSQGTSQEAHPKPLDAKLNELSKHANAAEPAVPKQRAPEAPVDVSAALEAVETNSSETLYRRNTRRERVSESPVEALGQAERKQVSIAAAAARAAGRRGSGLGRSSRSGRGGVGEAFGVTDEDLPVISGGGVFASGRKGALRGTLCFLPVGTKRLSNISRCSPEAVMYTNQLNVTPRRFLEGFPGVSERVEWFGIDFNGRFSVSKAGEYKFRLHSDDGSLLWINGQKVIDNDGLHNAESRMGSIRLDEGRHRLRVFYFQGPRVMIALQLFVTPPGEPERLWTPRL